MKILALVAGSILVFAILLDAFETIVLPRRVTRSFRFTALFYRFTWRPWAAMARFVPAPRRRESYLSYFGPLSLIVLLALWAFALIVGFALLQYGAGTQVHAASGSTGFGAVMYFSGSTFFTLGLGDVVPLSGASRGLAVLESGVGFGFLAMVIGYLPVIYSSFSRREVEISLLDARAGSPPSAQEFLSRMAGAHNQPLLDRFLHQWEHWAAEVLESHISYPVLALFRSQHINQSWLGALTTILDVSALIIVGIDGIASNQARLTFAMARHAVVDLAQVVGARYQVRRLTGCRLRLWQTYATRLRQMACNCAPAKRRTASWSRCAACTNPTCRRWRIDYCFGFRNGLAWPRSRITGAAVPGTSS